MAWVREVSPGVDYFKFPRVVTFACPESVSEAFDFVDPGDS